MIDYCRQIEETGGCMRDADRVKDHVYKNALSMCVLQIGELVSVLSDEFKLAHMEIPWRDVKAMRNIMAHSYGTVDDELLMNTVKEDIPALKDFCVRCLEGWSKEN